MTKFIFVTKFLSLKFIFVVVKHHSNRFDHFSEQKEYIYQIQPKTS